MIPNLCSKNKIPKIIPKQLDEKIKKFSKSKDKEIFLEQSFYYITKNWGGSRYNLIYKFSRLFTTNIRKILQQNGYMHCTTMNFLLRIMAVKSGLFRDEDIKIKLTNSWYIVPHQYLKFKISPTKYITLDPWNYQFGIDYGKYGRGFVSTRIKPIR